MLGLGLGLGLTRKKRAAAAGGSLNVELWPQVDFDATTGLTLNGWSHAAGVVTSTNTGFLAATSLGTLVAGVYHILIEITLNDPEDLAQFRIGGNATVPNGIGDGGTGVYEGDFTVAAPSNQLIEFRCLSGAGLGVTRFSVKQTA